MDDALRQRLIDAARAVRQHAYCPYSHFAVGAVLLDDAGRLHAGVNVENASYPVGVCAERAALGVAVSAGARRFTALALVTSASQAVAPCGMCRQALAEFAPDLLLILAPPEGPWIERRLSDVLPFQFQPDHLVPKAI